jgi:hypothetical protein
MMMHGRAMMLGALLLTSQLTSAQQPRLAAFSDFDSPAGRTGWSTSGPQQWSPRTGATPSGSTGPSSGRAGAADTYYYLEASPGLAGQAGRLSFDASVLDTACSHATVSFFYHMLGADMGTLEVQSADGTVQWSRSGDAGDVWRRASVPVGAPAFGFVGRRGSGCLVALATDPGAFAHGAAAESVPAV